MGASGFSKYYGRSKLMQNDDSSLDRTVERVDAGRSQGPTISRFIRIAIQPMCMVIGKDRDIDGIASIPKTLGLDEGNDMLSKIRRA